MDLKKKKILWTVLTAVFAVLLAALIVGTCVAKYYYVIVDRFFDCKRTEVQYFDQDGNKLNPEDIQSSGRFESEFSSTEERVAEQTKVSRQLVEEGSVLLKNDNGALPLAEKSKISLFNVASTDMIYGGGGSGAIDTSKCITLKDSLEQAGLSVNNDLWNVYKNSGKKRSVPGLMGGKFIVNEYGWDSKVSDAIGEYRDAAIVVLARTGGEGSDYAQDMLSGSNTEGKKEYSTAETNHSSILSLSDQEKQTFEELGKLKNTFGKIIVIVNSPNPMELGFLQNATYGIDACLWTGNVGQEGMEALGCLLAGKVNPSGRLVDTYASSALSAPSVLNSGNFSYANTTGVNSGSKYIVEEEGIYVGYRYYETRYEDCVLNRFHANSNAGAYDSKNGWNYAEEVIFPFGYGLSYTQFGYSDFFAEESADGKSFDLSVTVQNNGKTAGKEVVQFYFQSPYTEGGVEKSAIELCAFAKTEEIEPQASAKVTVTVPKEELRAYDYKTAKTYILDKGDYYFTCGLNAHDALNHVLAAKGKTVSDGMTANGNAELVWKWNNPAMDATIFSKDSETGHSITNLFDSANLTWYGLEQNVLSRSDWEKTFPQSYDSLTATDRMITDLKDEYQTDSSVTQMPVMGQSSEKTLVDARGLDYNDEVWTEILNSLTWDEMAKLVGTAGYHTAGIPKIDKGECIDSDGPAGISGELYGGGSGMGFPGEIVLASTWNPDLVRRMGEMVGEDALALGVTGWYAPATNIHRNAFAGRNYEYYSEDPLLSGKLAAAQTQGAQSKGMYVYVKHFAFNDQETNRIGLSTFAYEQAMREIYLEPFEIAVQEGNAHGIMSSFNRVGCQWTGASRNLLTGVLRTEWGFDGHVVTDASMMSTSYMRIANGLKAGNDCWLSTSDAYVTQINAYKNDAAMANWLREATHRVLYSTANSSAMNSYIVDDGITTKTIDITPFWEPTLIAIDIVFGLLLVGSAVVLALTLIRSKKRLEN